MRKNRINIPQLLPNESVAGFVERYHWLSCNTSKRATLRTLFDAPIRTVHPFTPFRIAQFGRYIGVSKAELLHNHTAYPLFAYFTDGDTRKRMEQRLLNSPRANSTAVGGLIHTPEIAAKPFYCGQCISNDISKYGINRRLVIHQLPGFTACAEHALQLQHLDDKQEHPSPGLTSDITISKLAEDLIRITRARGWLDDVQQRYWWKLQTMQMATSGQHIRYHAIEEAFYHYWRQEKSSELVGLLSETLRLLPQILHGSTSRLRHPIKHLLISGWLFDGDLEAIYEISPPAARKRPKRSKSDNLDSTATALRMLSSGLSRRRIAHATQLSPAMIIKIANEHGLPVSRRPKFLTATDRKNILSLAQKNDSLEEISAKLGLHEATICKIIEETPQLVANRKAARFAARQLHHRTALSNYFGVYPQGTKTEVRAACYRSWMWLYRHDKKWLESTLPKSKKKGRTRRDRSNRDEQLTLTIDAILAKVKRPLTLTDLRRQAELHDRIYDELNELPQTRARLKKAIDDGEIDMTRLKAPSKWLKNIQTR
ncbi:TnsD family Tn7-like transposition protein [Zhongshania antarctica]|nr:TnsD family Tn7-like transposition protein [Zhongshania antarctica]